jgi:hypothetical protein
MASILNVDQINNAAGTSAISIDSSGNAKIPGSVVQVASTATILAGSTTSTTFVDLLSLSFTPKFSTSSLFVFVDCRWQSTGNTTSAKFKILHDSTSLWEIDYYGAYASGATNMIQMTGHHAQVPAGSTSARNIKWQGATVVSGTLTLNVNGQTGNETRMTVMEIAQ